MLSIGIDPNQGLVYEGSGRFGRAVWPMPTLTPAKIAFESEGPLSPEKTSDNKATGCRFREDFFDPTSRIRRGRFYTAGGTLLVEWQIQPHPAMPFEMASNGGRELRKELETYQGQPFWNRFRGKPEQPLVLLGLDDRFTIWTVVDVEAISTGEDLVTLKARGSLGVLPVMDYGQVPEDTRGRLRESLDALVDEVHRSAPVSVVDRARDAASQILISRFEVAGRKAKDLSTLTGRLEKEEKVIAASACKIISRLHARAKPVERVRRELRHVREQDAELAVQCVGTLLCELGWAEWA